MRAAVVSTPITTKVSVFAIVKFAATDVYDKLVTFDGVATMVAPLVSCTAVPAAFVKYKFPFTL